MQNHFDQQSQLRLKRWTMLRKFIIFITIALNVAKNAHSPLATKRILRELSELAAEGLTLTSPRPFNETLQHSKTNNTRRDPDCGIRLSPIRGNLFEWHFTFTGIEGSVYQRRMHSPGQELPRESAEHRHVDAVWTLGGEQVYMSIGSEKSPFASGS